MDIIIQQTTNPNDTVQTVAFIPAFLEDNVIGLDRDPEYENRLMARDKQTSRALRYGRWDVFGGQLFSEWVKPIHTCAPIEIPASWTRWRAVDWGFAAPFCCLWFARDPDTRRVYVYRELYQVGLSDPQQAEKIRDLSLPGESFAFTFADPSMWERKTIEMIIKSTADVYAEHGVLLTKAANNQQQKIAKTRAALANIHDGKPAVLIFNTCANLIRTMPALMNEPGNPEQMMNGQEDHAWDTYAYGLTAWTSPGLPKQDANKKKTASPLARTKGL